MVLGSLQPVTSYFPYRHQIFFLERAKKYSNYFNLFTSIAKNLIIVNEAQKIVQFSFSVQNFQNVGNKATNSVEFCINFAMLQFFGENYRGAQNSTTVKFG